MITQDTDSRMQSLLPTTLLAGALCVLGGCAVSEEANSAGAQETTMTIENASLQTKIDDYKAGFASRADQEMKDSFQDGIDDVLRQGVLDRATNVGDTAPAFVLPNASGKSVALGSLLADGPVIVVWYRGGWCPYCNLTLRAYQERLDEITGLGATLVAISPELPDNALSTKEKGALEYEVLTDLDNRVAREYGVVFDLTEDVHRRYNELFGFDDHNGQASGELPLSATYVIDTDGTVTYAFLHHDYRERAEPSEVIDALRTTVGG